MLNPSVVDLLRGVADALAATVADRLPAGPEKDQVTTAVAVVRRVARALPTLVPAIQADTQALASAVVALAGSAGDGDVRPAPEVVEALALVARLPAEPLPALDELVGANLALRSALAAFADRDGLAPAVDAALRAELAALAAREAALRLSPWEP